MFICRTSKDLLQCCQVCVDRKHIRWISWVCRELQTDCNWWQRYFKFK